ncbi:GNAT family N-acetyltransferase [Synoicihabitans lomoniglobus]|uniref:Aminoglycoside N(6')-acetyltransferase type 1 n=1 Tax=Synoicihabitans lomoniglobus TaxID=2909285 RepID=A0AAF0CGV3_9BACT|nr:GNAT family N-acetyltransferase [Opitutaceae bacterium LMO-M01]WED63752.1 GNAT family N-acetyltransferase [Opitutaceae bacterium LMO-M01]
MPDASDYRIRAATPADDDVWARLRHALWPECPPARHAEEIALYRQSPGLVALALDAHDHAVGFAETTIRHEHVTGTAASPVPYLEGWFVESAWRGRGVGRALIDFVAAWARTQGFAELASDTELANVSSQAAHTRLGFRETERVVHYLKPLSP